MSLEGESRGEQAIICELCREKWFNRFIDYFLFGAKLDIGMVLPQSGQPSINVPLKIPHNFPVDTFRQKFQITILEAETLLNAELSDIHSDMDSQYTYFIIYSKDKTTSLQVITYNIQLMIDLKIKQDDCFDQKPADNISLSTLLTNGESLEQSQVSMPQFLIESSDRFYRSGIFCLKQGLKKLGPKTNRSAVNWILTNCWIKNFDLDTTALSVVLYYAYSLNHPVDKSKLQLILSVSIYSAKKYMSRPSMDLEEAVQMTCGKFTKEDLLEVQYEMAELVQFNFHFDHTLHLLTSYKLSEIEEYSCQFLIQILLMKDQRILFEVKELESVIEMVKNVSSQTLIDGLEELLNSKQSQSLVNKYKSAFEINQFIDRIQGCMKNNESKRHSA